MGGVAKRAISAAGGGEGATSARSHGRTEEETGLHGTTRMGWHGSEDPGGRAGVDGVSAGTRGRGFGRQTIHGGVRKSAGRSATRGAIIRPLGGAGGQGGEVEDTQSKA